MVSKKNKKAPPKSVPQKKAQPKKRWINDPDGKLAIAKSIAARFAIDIVEEEFFVK